MTRNIFFIALAYLFLGLAFIAVLPPFEGFDEDAHYAYLQQFADTNTIPAYGIDHVGADGKNLKAATTIPATDPQTRAPLGALYSELDADKRAAIKNYLESTPTAPRHYAPAGAYNWQAQHAPLYYVFMTPFYKISAAWPWKTHLFFLRAISFLMIWAGFCAMLIAAGKVKKEWQTGLLLVPVFVPQFFPEFARLGNDNLCFLLIAAIFTLLCRLMLTKRILLLLPLGFMIGLGALTKAFFLPIGAGLALWLFCYFRKDKNFWPCAIGGAAIALLLAAPWYGYKFLHYGSLIGADEFIRINAAGGLWQNLLAHFSLAEFLHGFAAMIATFFWAGTWSLVRLPEIFHLLLIIPAAFILCGYLKTIKKDQSAAATLPLFLLLPVLTGFCYHILVRLAFTGIGAGTPAWYFLILTPCFAIIIAAGWQRLSKKTAYITFLPILYAIAAWTAQILFFAGYLYKDNEKHFALSEKSTSDIWPQLAALGMPVLAMLFMLVALTLITLHFSKPFK